MRQFLWELVVSSLESVNCVNHYVNEVRLVIGRYGKESYVVQMHIERSGWLRGLKTDIVEAVTINYKISTLGHLLAKQRAGNGLGYLLNHHLPHNPSELR